MTIRPADARALVALARERGVELIVGYPWHWNRTGARAARRASRRARSARSSTSRACSHRRRASSTAAVRSCCATCSAIRSTAPGDSTYCRPGDRRRRAGPDAAHAQRGAALLADRAASRSRVGAMTADFELGGRPRRRVAVRFDNGAIGSLWSTGSLSPGYEEILEYRIFGSEGHLLIDPGLGIATIARRGEPPVTPAAACRPTALPRGRARRGTSSALPRPRHQRLAGRARRAGRRARSTRCTARPSAASPSRSNPRVERLDDCRRARTRSPARPFSYPASTSPRQPPGRRAPRRAP